MSGGGAASAAQLAFNDSQNASSSAYVVPASTYVLADTETTALLLTSALIFFQGIGFASLEAGNVRAKNARNILLKNIVDKLICGLGFWATGFAFAYGTSAGGVIGTSGFFLADFSPTHAALWFMSFMFLITATTIVSGALAERAQFEAYVAYTPVMSMLVYPLVVHWAVNGWLTTFAPHCQYLDFAGGSTVHLLGGVSGLVAAWLVGPRLGRFDADGEVKPMVGHDVSAIVIGTLLLWFGWYGFNSAPAYLRGDFRTTVAARCFVNTTLAGCSGSLAALALGWARSALYDLRATCYGALGGLVSITSVSPHVDPWAAVLIGALAGGMYVFSSKLLLRLRIDDPLDSFPVHGACSLVGLLLGHGFLARPDYLAVYRTHSNRLCGGIFHTSRGWEQLGVQLLGVTVIASFSGVCSFMVFYTLRRTGRLRVDRETEIAGIDMIDHGGVAYPDFQLLSHD